MALYYYLDKNKVRKGPLSIEDMDKDEIMPTTLVWTKGMQNWEKAQNVSDFAPFFGNRTNTSLSQVVPQTEVGNTQDAQMADNTDRTDDKAGCFMIGLSFLIPIVGIVLYFVQKEEKPQAAKTYLIWAIVSFAIGLFINMVS